MKVKIIRMGVFMNGEAHRVNSEIEMDDVIASDLIHRGFAEPKEAMTLNAPVSEKGNSEKDLEVMNVKELKAIAEKKGIDVKGKKKAELIELIDNADSTSENEIDDEDEEEFPNTNFPE